MLYVPVANGLNAIVFDHTFAVVVVLTHTHEKLIVHASVEMNMKLGVAVPVLLTAHAVKIGGVVSPPQPVGGKALQVALYAVGRPSQIHPSGSEHDPFDVMIVNILSDKHCCHCAKTMLGLPPIHIVPSTSVHRA